MSDEAKQIATLAMLADKFGWLPSQVLNERADLIDYIIEIENFKAQRQQREK